MITKGTFSASAVEDKYTLKVDWTAEQNLLNNTATITLQVYLVQVDGATLAMGVRGTNKYIIDGISKSFNTPAINNKGGVTTHLATLESTEPVVLNADGSKEIPITVNFNWTRTFNDVVYNSIIAETTIALPVINSYFMIGGHRYDNYINSLKVSSAANYNAQTNAAGNTVVDYINKKRTIEVGIIALDDTVMKILLADISNLNVTVSFRNPVTNNLDNVACIIPTNNIEYYTIQSNKVMYKAFTLTFIEL